MDSPFSAVLFACERLLLEQDAVFTAIRIVEVFYWNPDQSELPPEEKQPFVYMSWYCHIKRLDGVSARHRIRFALIHPNGEERDRIGEIEVDFTSVYEDAHPGAIIPVNMRIRPQELGRYQLIVYVDDQEISRGIVTLVWPPRADQPA